MKSRRRVAARNRRVAARSSYRSARPRRALRRKRTAQKAVARQHLKRTHYAIRHPPIVRANRVQKIVVRQRIVPRQPKVRRNTLRLELQPLRCRRRKAYKKTMLKKLAAQASGSGTLNTWRKNRAKNTNIVYNC